MSNKMKLLNIISLKKIFRTGSETIVVLKDINLSVDAGSTIVITGESGCGKSTLLNLIGGLDSVSSGSIFFKGSDISNTDESGLTEYRCRELGFIFQFHYLLKDFTACENLLIPAFISGKRKAEALPRAEELISKVGLFNRKNHYPVQLSGGERQRIAVARALMNDPDIILADEPTGNLDERNSKAVKDLLFGLVEDYGKTMILATHDEEMAHSTDCHYVLEHGVLEYYR